MRSAFSDSEVEVWEWTGDENASGGCLRMSNSVELEAAIERAEPLGYPTAPAHARGGCSDTVSSSTRATTPAASCQAIPECVRVCGGAVPVSTAYACFGVE